MLRENGKELAKEKEENNQRSRQKGRSMMLPAPRFTLRKLAVDDQSEGIFIHEGWVRVNENQILSGC